MKDLLKCMELLIGTGNRLDELLWAKVTGEASEGDMMVGDKEPAIRVRKWTESYLSSPSTSLNQCPPVLPVTDFHQ